MNLKIKTQEKGEIIESENRKMIPPEEIGKCPFPNAKVGDLLYFKIRDGELKRNGELSLVPLYEFIININEDSLETERINSKKGIVEIMSHPFEYYIYCVGDFYNNSKPLKIIKDTSDYQRIENELENLGIKL